jgi:hypothetical protein
MLRLVIFLAVVFWASPVLGATCTLNTTGDGITIIGPWGTEVGAGTDCNPGDNNDVYVVPEGAEFVVGDDLLTITSPNNGFQIIGGTFTWDQTTAPGTITLFGGTTSDGESKVAFYADGDSTLNITGGFAQWGVEVPALQSTHTDSNFTTFVIDKWGACNGAADTIGTCSGGTNEYLTCFHYTDARNNPEEGNTGENWLEESMGAISAITYRVRMLTGGEKAASFEIASVDGTDPYSICVDTSRSYDDEVTVDFPKTMRASVSGAITATAVGIGAESVTSVASVIAADGDQVGRCALFCDASSANCDRVPYKISKTVEGGANDIIYFSDKNPLRRALVASADFVITECFSSGDTFTVERPAWFVDGTPEEDLQGKILIESQDINFTGPILITGPATVKFYGGAIFNNTVRYFDVIDAGDSTNSLAGLEFEDMASVALDWWSVSGGDGVTGNADQIELDGVGSALFTNGDVRYNGSYAISTIGLPSTGNGSFYIADTKFSYSGIPAAATVSIHIDETNYWNAAGGENLFCFDCTHGNISDFIRATIDAPFPVDGMIAYTTYASAEKGNAHGAFGVTVNNYFSRNTVGSRGGTYSFLPSRMTHCDIKGMTVDKALWTGTNSLTYAGTGEVGETYIEDCLIGYIQTNQVQLLNLVGRSWLRNVILYESSSSNASPRAPIKVSSHGTEAQAIEYVTVAWVDDETAKDWLEGVWVSGDNGGALSLGGIAVSGLYVDDAGDAYGINVDTSSLLTDHTTFISQNCVEKSQNVGGAFTAVANIGDFPVVPRIGFPLKTMSEAPENYVMAPDSQPSSTWCGAFTGAAAPGIQPHKWNAMAEALLINKVNAPVVTEPNLF